ncbi:LysM peptidoglycan-binding domain-containing protein [Jeotgalibacillus sp. S-D1]|uniref:C40 family peptidase n=1 Tax=Jeotgalibacillus sp. S-D1 TaxID=2552189 RepID=UPI00105A4A73|nr:LysM peptidoglycan-binding domain-containing C40 family peptidase [Jeotgalibacillus sp. S-D1]TDL32781.1 LysM peptidoglycan-binding domain-containing protein [Jeotgalibacillus sp. S-D1]
MKTAGVLLTIILVSLFGGIASEAEVSQNAGAAASSNHLIHTVQAGDTLFSIANKNDMTVESLMEINQLTSTLILPGQELKVNENVAGPDSADASSAGSQPGSNNVISIAMQQLDIPYVWGGSTPDGFDCSGFIYYVFKEAGYSLSRTNAEDQHARAHIVDAAQPGDLVFFENTYKVGISHVGIYLGNNQFIHANDGRGVQISSLDGAYWQEKLEGFRRFTVE